MRILHITSVIDGRNNSGTARVAYEIISELNQRVGITQTFLHFDLSDSDIYKLPGTTEVLLKPSGKLWGARYLSFFKYALKQNILWRLGKLDKYDVVHWHVGRIYPFFFLSLSINNLTSSGGPFL